MLIKVQPIQKSDVDNAYMEKKNLIAIEGNASRNMQYSTQEDESKTTSPHRTVGSSMINQKNMHIIEAS